MKEIDVKTQEGNEAGVKLIKDIFIIADKLSEVNPHIFDNSDEDLLIQYKKLMKSFILFREEVYRWSGFKNE